MPTSPDESDDYELAPVDPAVIAHERRLAEAEIAAAERTVDINDAYTRDAAPATNRGLGQEGTGGPPAAFAAPRFSLKTILTATTALALVAGAWVSGVSFGLTFAGGIGLSLVGLCCAHAWTTWSEQRRRARAEHLLDARRDGLDPDPDWIEEDWRALLLSVRRQARLRFSITGLFGLTTLVACLGVLTTAIGVPAASALLGIASLAGFVAMAAGFSAAKPLVTAWWLAIAGYVALNAASVVGGVLGIGGGP